MLVVLVNIHVKPEFIEQFKVASQDNARNSVKEAGIARFDIVQQTDDPTRFVLVEVYRSENAPADHRGTEHYQKWRAAVETMMAEPRTRAEYRNVFPARLWLVTRCTLNFQRPQRSSLVVAHSRKQVVYFRSLGNML